MKILLHFGFQPWDRVPEMELLNQRKGAFVNTLATQCQFAPSWTWSWPWLQWAVSVKKNLGQCRVTSTDIRVRQTQVYNLISALWPWTLVSLSVKQNFSTWALLTPGKTLPYGDWFVHCRMFSNISSLCPLGAVVALSLVASPIFRRLSPIKNRWCGESWSE